MILSSKYFSSAKEKRKRENIAISTDGINVNREKKMFGHKIKVDLNEGVEKLIKWFRIYFIRLFRIHT